MVEVEFSRITDAPVGDDELETITNEVERVFGVDKVTTVVEYETFGSMVVEVPRDATEEEVVADIRDALAEMLSLDPAEVEVTVNMETGDVLYTISADSFEDAEIIRDALDADNAVKLLEDNTDTVGVESINAGDNIRANVLAIVDGDETTTTANNGENLLELVFGDDYEIDTGGKLISSKSEVLTDSEIFFMSLKIFL